LVFYGLLERQTVNIPFLDDYAGVLGFVSAWFRLGSTQQKIMDILTSQHNEYKPMFSNSVYILQYLLLRHINFSILSMIGNLFLLPLCLVIYSMWTRDSRAIRERVLLFVPVSWLLFQFQYYSLLSWPVSTLQNIPVILFSLLTLYLLSIDRQTAFYLSLVSLSLAIATSGNGFFVIPIGCVMLLQFRRPTRLVYWLSTSAAMLALYLYRYNFMSSPTRTDHSVVSSLHHISPVYALSFLGASIARYGNYVPAAILGGCLCVMFVYTIKDKLYATSPAIFYSICFIVITSLAVSGLRSDLGITQSLVSRYRIYSNLLLIFVYLYGVGKVQGRLRTLWARRTTATIIAILAIGFNVGSNYAGFKLLRARTALTKEGLYRWEHGEQSITTAPGPANEDPVILRQRLSGNYAPENEFLREAIRLHVYSPPF
jgi:hypothetical protein